MLEYCSQKQMILSNWISVLIRYTKSYSRGRQFNCPFEWQKILYNSKGLDVLVQIINLLVKYYVPLAHINIVIKLLKFKSAINLNCL